MMDMAGYYDQCQSDEGEDCPLSDDQGHHYLGQSPQTCKHCALHELNSKMQSEFAEQRARVRSAALQMATCQLHRNGDPRQGVSREMLDGLVYLLQAIGLKVPADMVEAAELATPRQFYFPSDAEVLRQVYGERDADKARSAAGTWPDGILDLRSRGGDVDQLWMVHDHDEKSEVDFHVLTLAEYNHRGRGLSGSGCSGGTLRERIHGWFRSIQFNYHFWCEVARDVQVETRADRVLVPGSRVTYIVGVKAYTGYVCEPTDIRYGRLVVRLVDGREFTTRDPGHRGTVPKAFRQLLPSNAEIMNRPKQPT